MGVIVFIVFLLVASMPLWGTIYQIGSTLNLGIYWRVLSPGSRLHLKIYIILLVTFIVGLILGGALEVGLSDDFWFLSLGLVVYRFIIGRKAWKEVKSFERKITEGHDEILDL